MSDDDIVSQKHDSISRDFLHTTCRSIVALPYEWPWDVLSADKIMQVITGTRKRQSIVAGSIVRAISSYDIATMCQHTVPSVNDAIRLKILFPGTPSVRKPDFTTVRTYSNRFEKG